MFSLDSYLQLFLNFSVSCLAFQLGQRHLTHLKRDSNSGPQGQYSLLEFGISVSQIAQPPRPVFKIFISSPCFRLKQKGTEKLKLKKLLTLELNFLAKPKNALQKQIWNTKTIINSQIDENQLDQFLNLAARGIQPNYNSFN